MAVPSLTSLLLPVEMQVREAEMPLRATSGSATERWLALAAACLAASAALVAAVVLG